MYYFDFKGKKISALGFGLMRLPVKNGVAADIDIPAAKEMIATAIEGGVNYFDTAWPYHAGYSELAVKEILSAYPRENYFLADKFPGHQISESYNVREVFESQLKKCGVEYFDFYLLHNVYENSLHVYEDKRWGIMDYLSEQKKNGRIKHLGFSTHAGSGMLSDFLKKYGDVMEFCQLQLNYLDWDLQDAKSKYALCASYNIPVWVMEPIRGGKLAELPEDVLNKLNSGDEKYSPVEWSFKFISSLENIGVTLSGMSNLDQVKDNLRIFSSRAALSEEQKNSLFAAADSMRNDVPCTKCRYCIEGCPMGLDIPMFIEMLNEMRFAPGLNSAMRLDALDEDKKPSACIGCGSCEAICPQKINIPSCLKELADSVSRMPKWADISKQRAAEAEKLKKLESK